MNKKLKDLVTECPSCFNQSEFQYVGSIESGKKEVGIYSCRECHTTLSDSFIMEYRRNRYKINLQRGIKSKWTEQTNLRQITINK